MRKKQSVAEEGSEKIYQLLEDFYLLCGIPIQFYNTNYVLIKSCPDVQAAPKDHRHLLAAADRARDLVFQEEAGVLYQAIPLQDHEITLAYLLSILPTKREAGTGEPSADETKTKRASSKGSAAAGAEQRARACANLLRALAAYLLTQDFAYLQKWKHFTDQFKAAIWDLLDQDLNAESLAGWLHIGKTKLYEDFHKYAGTTVAQYLLNVRMEKARFLLEETDLSVTQVASRVGFYDYNYFCRVFRRQTGMSPKNYRTECRMNS